MTDTETARLHDEILTGKAEIAKLRDLLTKENKRANQAIDREETAEQAAEEARAELKHAHAALARIRQMADHWEQHLPEVIRTPAVVSALRAALDRVSSAVVAPPTDQTALRDRIADKLTADAYECDGKCGLSERECYDAHPITFSAMAGGTTHVDGSVTAIADAVLAVLPTTDRAAVLRDAIDLAREEAHRLEEEVGIEAARGARCVAYLLRKRLAKEQPLRRLADECPQCGTTGACNGGPCPLRRMADETATTEVVPCVRPEPHPAHSHSGLRKGTAVHGRCPGVPAAGARQSDDPDRIVAYRSRGGRLLRCLAHHPGREAIDSGDFRPVTADELPDGGICTYPTSAGSLSLRCGVDVLIPQPAAGARQDEPVVTVHTAPDLSPAAEDALGALIDVAKQQATEGWRGATEVISDAEVQRLAATGLVGYRQGRGQLLHCLHHKPVPASRWADFHEVTAEDLPDGGICVHPRCGADLLAVQPAAREDGGAR